MSDALSELLTELSARFAPGADAREVEIYLASRGYDARQIGEIMAAFAAHLDDADGIPANAVGAPSRTGGAASTEGPTFRVLGAHERGRFAPEAWGHLLALTAAGTLAPHDREHLIDRALTHNDGRIGLAELRALLESAGLDDGGSASTTIH